ncbi:helix-turn-helix transcriptional regulator [Halalkalibaculum sp. DA3122]|uniref:helix-turn-helix transcriptional regulator n=1 Tax=Halalkalibaculum sp. DA3122 TaxID=3373607 RepID=UPI0037540C81
MEKSLHILRPSDLADMLNVSRVTIWRMQKRGELPPRKKFSNRCVGWDSRTIENWFESRPYADPKAEEKRESELEPVQ